MNCYLCNSSTFNFRKGQVRDAPELRIRECTNCGLVSLDSQDHIQEGFYERSGMHGDEALSIDGWLIETDRDDERRFDMLKSLLAKKKVLDFGCGAGGFLKKVQPLAKAVAGIELEERVQEYWRNQITIHSDIESAGGEYDVVTAFHVVEHLSDPIAILKGLAKKLGRNGRMVVEVPSSEDALLTLYDSDAFQHFTYWSQHLFLFNSETLRQIAVKAGLRILSIKQYQRYPLSNHLYWLSQGKSGGHQQWSFLDSTEMSTAYANTLAGIGKCDTLIAYLEQPD